MTDLRDQSVITAQFQHHNLHGCYVNCECFNHADDTLLLSTATYYIAVTLLAQDDKDHFNLDSYMYVWGEV